MAIYITAQLTSSAKISYLNSGYKASCVRASVNNCIPVWPHGCHVRPPLSLNYVRMCLSYFHTDSQPTLQWFNGLPTKAGLVSVRTEIGTKYFDFGVHLLDDTTGSKIQAMEKEFHNNAAEINQRIFMEWLQGSGIRPVSWQTLVGVLRDIQLNTLADKIECAETEPSEIQMPKERKLQLVSISILRFAFTVFISLSIASECKFFQNYLKCKYKREIHQRKGTQWPKTLNTDYINLVLVSQDKIKNMRKSQKMTKLIKRGQIQAIIDGNEFQQLSLSDIISCNSKVVVIEGAPGIGKTTLAQKLCQDWAHDMLLKDFSLVVYIPLRMPSMRKLRVSETLDELFSHFGEFCSESELQFIISSLGERLLLVLDGWDELRPSCRDCDMFFPRLIQGELLPNCSIIVTSRPGVTADIMSYADRVIEILGFTDDQISQYIHLYFKEENHDLAAEKLIEDLEHYPNVRTTCYVPINLTIVCYVYWVSDYELPPTLSEVYQEFIFHAVKRDLMRISDIENPSKCHSLSKVKVVGGFGGEVKSILKTLGQLALKGLENNELTFSEEELNEVYPSMDESETQFDGFGLLKVIHVSQRHGTEKYYNFLHFTIQEYLAAYAIAQKTEDEQHAKLVGTLKDSRFNMMLKFFYGIDKFTSPPACEIFHKEISELVTTGQIQLMSTSLMFYLECIFEGQWAQGCHDIAKFPSMSFSITQDIHAYHALVIGYVLAMSNSTWHLHFSGCRLGEIEIKCIGQNLCEYPTTLKHLSIRETHLSSQSVRCLAVVIQSQSLLTELVLADAGLSDETFDILCSCLCHHGKLEVLDITNNNLTFASVSSIIDLLKHLKALQVLLLVGNSLGDNGCREISSSCSTIKKIQLPPFITDS